MNGLKSNKEIEPKGKPLHKKGKWEGVFTSRVMNQQEEACNRGCPPWFPTKMVSNKRGDEGEEVAGVSSSDWWLGGSIRAREMEEMEKRGCCHCSWKLQPMEMEKMREKKRVESLI